MSAHSDKNRKKATLVRSRGFSAGVNYQSKNGEKFYGALARLAGLGFNYRLEAYFEGEIDPLTGMVENLADVDRWMKLITDQLDHQLLNELKAFSSMPSGVPTTERVAAHCFHELQRIMRSEKAKARLARVVIHEGAGVSVAVNSKNHQS